MEKIRYFFRVFLPEVRAELGKVTFPSREEVVQTSAVVLVSSFIFAFYLWLSDLVIVFAYEQVFRLARGILG